MTKMNVVCCLALLAVSPVYASSIRPLQSRENPSLHFKFDSADKHSFWLTSSTHSDFDRDFDSIGKVRFSHESYRVHCDPKPSGDPDDAPVVAAVPEVPTAWLMLLGSFAILGARRLRGAFGQQS